MSEEPTKEETIDDLLPDTAVEVGQHAIDARVESELDKAIEADLAEMDGEGGGEGGEETPAAPAAPEPVAQPTPTPEPPKTEPTPEDKAKALAEERAAAGRWGAEKQAYEKRLKELSDRLEAMEAGRKAEAKAPAAAETPSKPEEITDADLDAELDADWRDNYSREEAVKALQRQRAQEERAVSKAEARISAKLEAERVEAEKAAEAAAARAEAEAALREEVRALVPGIDALDASPEFNEYLSQSLPGTMGTRLDAAKAAIASAANGGDRTAAAKAVADIYRGFQAKTAGDGPAAATRKPARPNPANYQVPATSGSGAAARKPEARTYRKAEVDAWVAAGWAKGDAEGQRREEAAIGLELDGRITD